MISGRLTIILTKDGGGQAALSPRSVETRRPGAAREALACFEGGHNAVHAGRRAMPRDIGMPAAYDAFIASIHDPGELLETGQEPTLQERRRNVSA